ncbi:hypothetical protein GUA46_13900 [Muricauda sp. HICW]|uniref:GIY-YIG domain-containing protein n=1 Tax=Flagellimonas chongwuensis TaxID=2697365 RepID=A0A850NI33_9FLAO|nr:hypothetical protein [Allomuricauda chongwuensis]NVN19439.1 hypothetical protein [Allomuricauda chongwuensis]
MKIALHDGIWSLEELTISVLSIDCKDVFQMKTNRSLGEMLEKREYKALTFELHEMDDQLSRPIGTVLSDLKKQKNNVYKMFLNKYGDSSFCSYKATSHHWDKGLYFYIVENKPVYVGRCANTKFGPRINDYGKITAANVYKTGQSTNCRINSKINTILREEGEFKIGLYIMNHSTVEEISQKEKEVLSNNFFPWNVQKR